MNDNMTPFGAEMFEMARSFFELPKCIRDADEQARQLSDEEIEAVLAAPEERL